MSPPSRGSCPCRALEARSICSESSLAIAARPNGSRPLCLRQPAGAKRTSGTELLTCRTAQSACEPSTPKVSTPTSPPAYANGCRFRFWATRTSPAPPAMPSGPSSPTRGGPQQYRPRRSTAVPHRPHLTTSENRTLRSRPSLWNGRRRAPTRRRPPTFLRGLDTGT